MQFTPGTWTKWALDANPDATDPDPQNIFHGTRTTAAYLCGKGEVDLTDSATLVSLAHVGMGHGSGASSAAWSKCVPTQVSPVAGLGASLALVKVIGWVSGPTESRGGPMFDQVELRGIDE